MTTQPPTTQIGSESRAGFIRTRILNPVVMKLRLAPGGGGRGVRTEASRLVTVRPIEYEGARYVVANRGDSSLARTLRTTRGGELLGRLGRKYFRAVEVKGAERERVVSEYRRQLGRAVKDFFEQLPNPAEHPTFRIEAAEPV